MYRRFGKRFLDVVVSALLLVGLLPLLLLTAVAVKITSRGPVLFCQTRVTISGRRFRIFKFRTLVDRPREIRIEMPSRDELTIIGAFLRWSYLDELLQFWNVIVGDMSLIGPRPWEDAMAERARADFDPTNDRYAVRAGMLGYARALSGRRPARWPEYGEDVALDIFYGKNCSFLLDVQIVFLTFYRLAPHQRRPV